MGIGLHGIDGKQGKPGLNSENFIGIMGRFVANKIDINDIDIIVKGGEGGRG